MPALDKRIVRLEQQVTVISTLNGREEVVGQFTVRAEAADMSDKQDVRGLVETANRVIAKRARAMAAGVDNNEAERLK